jgi:hypothetical protein
MPSRSGPRGGVATADFTARQWEFLVRLPGRVIVAAAAAGEADPTADPRRTVAEGIAGLEAVAAGRSNDCDLVRDVVTAIYAERAPAGRPAGAGASDDIVAACRRATKVLARADPADSAAYRQWIQSIAAPGCAAGRPAPGVPAVPATLGKALDLA